MPKSSSNLILEINEPHNTPYFAADGKKGTMQKRNLGKEKSYFAYELQSWVASYSDKGFGNFNFSSQKS